MQQFACRSAISHRRVSSNGLSATALDVGEPAPVDDFIAAGIDAQAPATVNATRDSGTVASAGHVTAVGVNAMVGLDGIAE
ncbi:hypothetical protein [Burkholderia sp. AU28863]|uniref:hypothetical protein n=1 Tax=Burkholderia sp. AU28863 TaxID=2015352 RepID=UPI0015C63060|nr:hypothetical protein [Burkholderia sp. AU28863]